MKNFLLILSFLLAFCFNSFGTSVQFVDDSGSLTFTGCSICASNNLGGYPGPAVPANKFSVWSGSGPHFYNSAPTFNYEVPGGYGGWHIWVTNSVTHICYGPITSNGEALIAAGATPNQTLHFLSGTNVPAAQYTNYTFCAQNIQNVECFAYFYWNGSVAYENVVEPGGTICWTSPSVQYFPFPDPAVGYVQLVANTLRLDFNTNGQSVFNNTAPSNSATNNFATGGAGQITNVFTAPVVKPPTNLVTFGTATGSASESTLNNGFQLLHQDNLNLLTGQGVLHSDIQTLQYTLTNELGTITYQMIRSNNDAQFQIYKAITNLNLASSNSLSQSSSNVWVMNWPTNVDPTLPGISNLLAQIATNHLQGGNLSNFDWDAMQTAVQSGVNDDETAGTNMTVGNSDYDSAIADAPSSTSVPVSPIGDSWQINVGYLGVDTIDLNPMAYSWVSALAVFVRGFITWLIYAWGAFFIVREWNASQRSLSAVNPVETSQLEILGENWWQWMISASVCVVIAGAVAVVIHYAYTALLDWRTGLFVNPYASASDSHLTQALWLLDQFVPVALVVQSQIDLFVFRVALGQREWIATKIIRRMSGSPKNLVDYLIGIPKMIISWITGA